MNGFGRKSLSPTLAAPSALCDWQRWQAAPKIRRCSAPESVPAQLPGHASVMGCSLWTSSSLHESVNLVFMVMHRICPPMSRATRLSTCRLCKPCQNCRYSAVNWFSCFFTLHQWTLLVLLWVVAKVMLKGRYASPRTLRFYLIWIERMAMGVESNIVLVLVECITQT